MDLNFLAGIIKEDKLYFSSWNFNGLFIYDLVCGNCQLIDIFINEDEELCLHNKAILYKNEIWFIPNRASYIAYYDIDKKCISYLELPQEGREVLDAGYRKTFRFHCLYEEGASCCWLVPVGYNLFLHVDFEEKLVRTVSGWSSLVKSEDGKVNFYTGILKESIITFCSYDFEKELSYDIKTKKFVINELDNSLLKHRNIVEYQDKKIYIPSDIQNGLLVCSNNKIIKRIKLKNKFDGTKLYIVCMVRNNFLYLFPFNFNKIIKIDLDTQDIVAEILINDCAEGCFIQNVFNYKGVLYASSDRIGSIICLDKNDNYRIIQNVISKGHFYKKLLSLFDLYDYSHNFRYKSHLLNNWQFVYETDNDDLEILINGCIRFMNNKLNNEFIKSNGMNIYLSMK